MHKLLSGLFIAFVLITPREAHSGREIPDDNLAYPVLVTLDNDSKNKSSGFFLSTGTTFYLVTATHVLFEPTKGNLRANRATLLAYSKDPRETGKNILHLDLPNLLASNRIYRHSTEDVSVVHIADISEKNEAEDHKLKILPGVVVAEMSPSGLVVVDVDNVKRFEDVLVGNTIYVFGYPTSLGMKKTPQLDPLRPLLRFGIVAGTNPSKKTIILDCPSYSGNSGGPVLEVEQAGAFERRYRVIGVVSQFVPFIETWINLNQRYTNSTMSNSGYSIAVPMDPVLELVNSP